MGSGYKEQHDVSSAMIKNIKQNITIAIDVVLFLINNLFIIKYR